LKLLQDSSIPPNSKDDPFIPPPTKFLFNVGKKFFFKKKNFTSQQINLLPLIPVSANNLFKKMPQP